MRTWLDQRDLMRMVRDDPAFDPLSIQSTLGIHATGSIRYVAVEEGLFCALNDWRALRTFEDRLIVRNSLGIQIVQAGRVRQSLSGTRRYVHSGVRICVTAYPGEVRQRRRYDIGPDVKYIGAWIDPELLIDKFGLRPDGLPEPLRSFLRGVGEQPFSTSFPLAPRLWMAVDEIFSDRFSGRLRDVYLRSKLTELVCETVAVIGDTRSRGSGGEHPSLAYREQLSIESASHIYMQEMRRPPTLDVMARRVGLNRNKLAEGFQTIFGCTPHEYSKRHRMEWARRLLLERALCLQEIAGATGYSTQSAFSRAFTDHFGMPPSRVDRPAPDQAPAPD